MVTPVGYLNDVGGLDGPTIFSNYLISEFMYHGSNSNIDAYYGFRDLTKGKYLLKYYLRVRIKKVGSYRIGAILRRMRHTPFQHKVIWEEGTYKEVDISSEDNTCTILHTSIFTIDDDFDSRDYLPIYMYIKIHSGWIIWADDIETLHEGTSVTISKIQ